MKLGDVAIAQKIDDCQSFFLFRKNGEELYFKIVNNVLMPYRSLTEFEIKYINRFYIKNQHPIIEQLTNVSNDILDKLESRLQVLTNK